MKLATFDIKIPNGNVKVVAMEIKKGVDIPDMDYEIEDDNIFNDMDDAPNDIIEEIIEENIPDEVKDIFLDYEYIYQEFESFIFLCVFPSDFPRTFGEYIYDIIYSQKELLKEYKKIFPQKSYNVYKLNSLSQLLSIPRCKGAVYEANCQYYIQTDALLDDFLDKADKIPLNNNCILKNTKNLYEFI